MQKDCLEQSLRPPWMVEMQRDCLEQSLPSCRQSFRSSAIAPALPYYCPSMAICSRPSHMDVANADIAGAIICLTYFPVGKASAPAHAPYLLPCRQKKPVKTPV